MATFSGIVQLIKDLAEQRIKAKQDKNWALADSLRDQILSLGYTIVDDKSGTKIKLIS